MPDRKVSRTLELYENPRWSEIESSIEQVRAWMLFDNDLEREDLDSPYFLLVLSSLEQARAFAQLGQQCNQKS